MAVKFSISMQGSYPLRDYIDMAKKIESYGFDAINIYDDLMFKPTWPIVTLIGEHTESVEVGPGIVTPQVVHPAYHAGHLAELDELTGGRAVLGIGRGAFMEFLGIQKQLKPITMVRESIQIIRRLLAGDRTPFEGEIFSATEELFFRFKPQRQDIPIFIGTWGPKMCQLAGELATETKSDGMWDPNYVPILRENIDIGARRAGRDPGEVGICAGPLCSISNDRAAAVAAARQVLAVYLPYLHPMTEVSGVPADDIQQVRQAAAVGDFERGASYVSDLAVRKHSVSGTPADVIPQIEDMIAAGVTHIAFGHPLGPDFDEAVDLIGSQILPHFTS